MQTNPSRRINSDMAAARRAWLKEAKDNPELRAEREGFQFLARENEQGEVLLF